MMRPLLNKVVLLAVAVLSAACSRIDGPEQVTQMTFTALAEDNLTRTSMNYSFETLWNTKDSISVFGSAAKGYIFSNVTVSSDGREATFSGEIPEATTYRALYPSNKAARLHGDTITTTLPALQRAVANSFDPATGLAVAVSNTTAFQFKNVCALLGVVLRNSNVTSVTLYADGQQGVSLAGNCGIITSGSAPVAYVSSGVDSIGLSGVFEFDEVYYFTVFPGTYSNLKIVFTDRYGRKATFSNSKPVTACRSCITDIFDQTIQESDWKVAPGQMSADYCWPELPAQSDLDHNGRDDYNPDLYYSHTFRADAPSIRNFSSCYSESMIHPVWVAAPMHKCYLGSSGRNDSYQNDPQIPCAQSPKFSGYTRGHMVGSSDRTISVETNKQAFYYSNIGAQLQTGFNTGGGAWNNLEDKVDTYLCSDTLYQVIGCIFQTFTDRYGYTVSAKRGTNSVGNFQAPTAWYKCLLRTKSGNSGKAVADCSADELQCVAFILSHRSNASHKPEQKDMYSVSDLEQLTGLTYFVNVPNAPKSSFTPSDWGL